MHPFTIALKELNGAAYRALRACRDKSYFPDVDRQSLMLICRETDRLLDYGEESGLYPSEIQEAAE